MSVVYQGSQYHKRRASRWGAPALFSDKTACPEDVADEAVDAVFPAAIGAAIDRSDVSALRDGRWPRYVWGRSAFHLADGSTREIVWEARVVNAEGGVYKAYPVELERHSAHMPWRVKRSLWPRA